MKRTALLLTSCFLLVGCFLHSHSSRSDQPEQIIGIHLLSWTSDSLLVELGKTIPTLSDRGINTIFLEVDYNFEFQSHPGLRAGATLITREGAQRFAAICRQHGIRLIPQFQSLGHQSWAGTTFGLLTTYPEFDLTPGAFPGNEGIYCREWDPTNPRVNEIVFPLIDEIVEAFDADGIHVGMDEIFLLGHDESPSTRGKDPAVLFAQVVNELHDHFVKEQGLEMFMWGDRLIDGTVYPYGEYESSLNGTAPAVDMIPTDIVICDWHYEPMGEYASIPMFMNKGFRVLPSSWRKVSGVEAFARYSYSLEHPNMAGHLFTTWSRLDPERLVSYPPMLAGIRTIRSGRYYDVSYDLLSVSAEGQLTVDLTAARDDLAIHFSLDGSEPTCRSSSYEGPVTLTQSTLLSAVACQADTIVADVTQKRFTIHKGTGRPVTLTEPASPKYPAEQGASALVNGVTGSDSYADGQWVGAEGTGLEATIDLGAPTQISSVSVTTLNNRPNWVHQADRVEVSVSSDGQTFRLLGEVASPDVDDTLVAHSITFEPTTTHFVRIRIPSRLIPEGRSGAGNPAWLFVDEMVIE